MKKEKKCFIKSAFVVVHREMEKPGSEESESGTGPEGKSGKRKRDRFGIDQMGNCWRWCDNATNSAGRSGRDGLSHIELRRCGMPLFEKAADY